VVNCINGNSRMNPIEVYESRFPWLVEEYRLLPDTGGAGRHRGGLSLSKTLRCQNAEITVSFMSDRQKRQPWGVQGGRPAASGSILIEQGGSGRWRTFSEAFSKVSPSKFSNAKVLPGERVRLTTPGGGGIGQPSEREPALIEEDLREGWITPEGARRDYGYRR
jgi:N-methylhydantoinase B/oxoprolinase/acetone carboxylase alpha subunit